MLSLIFVPNLTPAYLERVYALTVTSLPPCLTSAVSVATVSMLVLPSLEEIELSKAPRRGKSTYFSWWENLQDLLCSCQNGPPIFEDGERNTFTLAVGHQI